MRWSHIALYAAATAGLGLLALQLEQNESETLYARPFCLPAMWHLFEVGPQKPLGYLDLGTIEENGYDVGELVEHFENAGKRTLLLEPENRRFPWGALYVYDPEALQALLDTHADILQAEGWPEDADAFVALVSEEPVNGYERKALYRLIGVAFNDQRFV